MGKLFRWDSPFMRFMTLVTNLICLNLLWLLFCLPVVTAGAATTAMYSCVFRYITKTDDSVIKPFVGEFRGSFRAVMPVWILQLFIGAALGAECFYLVQGAQLWLKVIFAILIFIYAGVSAYLYPLFARYEAPVKQMALNSVALAFKHLFSTVLMTLLNLLPLVLLLWKPEEFWKSSLLWVLGGFSLIAWVNGRILLTVFRKYDSKSVSK